MKRGENTGGWFPSHDFTTSPPHVPANSPLFISNVRCKENNINTSFHSCSYTLPPPPPKKNNLQKHIATTPFLFPTLPFY